MQRPSNFFNRRNIVFLLLVVIFAAVFMLLYSKIASDNTFSEVANIQPSAVPTVKIMLANVGNVANSPAAQHPPTNENTKATSSPNGQLVIIQRPDWTLAGTLLQHLPALKKLADRGDVKAAYILAMNLRFCVAVPFTEDDFLQRLQQVHQYQDDGVAVAELTERYEFCAGVDGQQRQQFYIYFAAAAEQGYVPAQEMIGLVTPEFYMKLPGHADLDRDTYVKKRDAFIQQKFVVLESASHQGSLNALMQLSQMHHSQNYTQNYVRYSSQKNAENGRVQAYAMNQLILELAQDNDLYNKYAWFQQKAQTELTPAEIDSALAISQQWLAIIRANGTLYLQ